MFDSVRRLLPLAMAAAMALTLMGQAALAQPDEEIAPARRGINAGTIDGKHAISSTGNKNKRKGRLMAFSAAGYLPSNIVEGGVATLTALESSAGAVNEVDNLVHWNQLLGVPPAVVAADTTVSIIAQTSPVIGVGATGAVIVVHPVTMDVETTLIPVVPGGFFALTFWPADPTILGEWFVRSADGTALSQILIFKNVGGVASAVQLRATVWNASFLSPTAAKQAVKATFYEKLPKRFRP